MTSSSKAIAGSDHFDLVNLPSLNSSVLLIVVVLLTISAYFSPRIWQHGEAREALVIQDILRNDHWILPLRNHELPSKPVFFHWIAAASARLFGFSDFVIRFPSLLGAALMLWLTYRLGTLDQKLATGLLAAGILGSTFEFWDSGTEARVDMLFASLIGLSLTGWYFWYRSAPEIARAATYLGIALAVLTKGPAGAILPAIVIVCFVAIERDFAKLIAFFSWRWMLVVLVIDVGWYVAAYQTGGADFWNKQIIHENFQRFIGAGDFEAKSGHLSQGVWLMTQLFPWSIVLLYSSIHCLCGQRQEPLFRFLHVWWLSIFLFFLLSSGQRSVYLLPIYPAVSLLVARELKAWEAARQGRLIAPGQFNPRAIAAVIVALFNLAVAVAIPISRTMEEDSSIQEKFVEDVMKIVPRTSRLYAAPDFPETTLLVLAYRLDRNIRRQVPECVEDYYYLTGGNDFTGCGATSLLAVLAAHKKLLNLAHNIPAALIASKDD